MTTQSKNPAFNERRRLLRGGGVAMALPWLSGVAQAELPHSPQTPGHADRPPQRFVAMTLGLGLIPENLVPTGSGRDYKPSRYLQSLQNLRDRVTVVSGSSHPGVTGGHRAEASILTGTPVRAGGQAPNTISIDQMLAKHLGDATRYPSLVLGAGGTNSPCYTESGAMISPETSASRLFADLFIDETVADRQKHAARVRQGRSIMDVVADDARSLTRQLGPADRNRLDAYLTSVRQLEQRMQASERWAQLPKPKVDARQPVDIRQNSDLPGKMQLMCDVMALALQTDSTRFITLHMPGSGGVVPLPGVDEAYHSLSHHGRDEEKLAQLALVEEAMIANYGAFLQTLADSQTADGNLLDQTTVLLTSNLGNSSNHDNRNMPVLIAGGGFRHAGHLAFDQRNNYPLTNFYVSLLQQAGLEMDTFSTGTGTMRGLEPVG